MTNAEKYKEVFGFEPDIKSCPTDNCNVCPLANQKYCTENKSDWWNSEYKVKVERVNDYNCTDWIP